MLLLFRSVFDTQWALKITTLCGKMIGVPIQGDPNMNCYSKLTCGKMNIFKGRLLSALH